jgi:uncharacterized protein (TIGR03435 family)
MRFALLVLLAAAQAQQEAPRLEYEVVSIKSGDPLDSSSSSRMPPGGMEMKNTTLGNLVRGAYGLNEYQLIGGPKWVDSAKFNIVAKYPAGATREQNPLMMRSMLTDRFKLVFHRETRMLSEYQLVLAKGGPNLTETPADDKKRGSSQQGRRQIKAWGAPVAQLARMLIGVVEAPVIDKTGLTGSYTFLLDFAPLNGSAEDEKLPSIFAVLQRIGLKLEPTKGPVEVLVIDKAEMPAEN